MEFYNIDTVQMIIEFLYSKFKGSFYAKQLTAYFVQFITFHALLVVGEICNEGMLIGYKQVDEDIEMSQNEKNFIVHFIGPVLVGINFIIVCFTIWNQIRYFKSMSVEILYTLNIWLDLTFIIGNAYMVLYFYRIMTNGPIPHTYLEGECLIHFRQAEVVCVISIYLKGMAFLRLFDSLAPLLDTLITIMRDIRAFLFVLYLFVFCFAVCFFLLG